MKSKLGEIYTQGLTNTCGELGHGNFESYKELKKVVYFEEIRKKIKDVDAGFKHVIA